MILVILMWLYNSLVVIDNIYTVERPGLKEFENRFVGLSSDNLQASNRHVNYLRDIYK